MNHGPSKSTQPHGFFEKILDNDLADLSEFLHDRYAKIIDGQIVKGKLRTEGAFEESNSISTMNYFQYNVFQFHHPALHNLAKAVREMVIGACNHYSLDFYKEQFMLQGWFNINHTKKGKLDWHDHGGAGAPFFHGYYCVSAEPSITHYRIFDKYEFDNVNKNNRAVLSETGHPHAMADWDWEGPRITVAYDVIPLRYVQELGWTEQHWFPLI